MIYFIMWQQVRFFMLFCEVDIGCSVNLYIFALFCYEPHQWCSGLPLGSVLRDHSCWFRILHGILKIIAGSATCKWLFDLFFFGVWAVLSNAQGLVLAMPSEKGPGFRVPYGTQGKQTMNCLRLLHARQTPCLLCHPPAPWSIF